MIPLSSHTHTHTGPVFTISPSKGVIKAGESLSCVLTFLPPLTSVYRANARLLLDNIPNVPGLYETTQVTSARVCVCVSLCVCEWCVCVCVCIPNVPSLYKTTQVTTAHVRVCVYVCDTQCTHSLGSAHPRNFSLTHTHTHTQAHANDAAMLGETIKISKQQEKVGVRV
jgi:hypothetical protein